MAFDFLLINTEQPGLPVSPNRKDKVLLEFPTVRYWDKEQIKKSSQGDRENSDLVLIVHLTGHKFSLFGFCSSCDMTGVQFGSVQFICCSAMSNSLRPYRVQHARPSCPSGTSVVYSNLCPLIRWCHPHLIPFSSCLQSFPTSESFQRVSSSHQVVKILEFQLQHQSFHWIFSPLGWTGWISLLSKGLSRVFSNTIVQKHQYFCVQLSL